MDVVIIVRTEGAMRQRSHFRLLGTIALTLVHTACGTATPDSADPVDGCSASAAQIAIGTGSTAYESISESDPVMMVHGPQGGWHMLGSIRSWNTTPIIRIAYTIRAVEEDVIISDNDYHVMLAMDEECSGYYPGMYGYLDVAPLADGDADEPAELLSYSTVELSMSIEDQDGRTASAVLDVTAIPDPQDVGDDNPDTGAP